MSPQRCFSSPVRWSPVVAPLGAARPVAAPLGTARPAAVPLGAARPAAVPLGAARPVTVPRSQAGARQPRAPKRLARALAPLPRPGARRARPSLLALAGLLGLGLALGVGAPRSARADAATESRIHFQQALAFVRQGNLQLALERFLLANRLAPNPNITFNIALCLDRLGRHEEAFVYYRELLTVPGLGATDRARARAALARLRAKIARVAVRSEPPGAAIYVDRESLGRYGHTPRVLAVSPGKRTLILKKPGYHPARIAVTARLGARVEARVRLRRILGRLRVETQPPGARVLVDGAEPSRAPRTPALLRLPLGQHTVALHLDGHAPEIRVVQVEANGERRLTVRLRRAAPARAALLVQSNVVGALVSVDGIPVGMTPLYRTDLAPGTHHVAVRFSGYEPWSKRLPFGPGQRVRVAVQLERSPRRTRRGPWVWITAGITAASLVATLSVAGAAIHHHQEYARTDTPTEADLRRGRALNVSADALIGVTSAAGLATLLTWWFTRPEPRRASKGRVAISQDEGAGPRPRR